ncbi:MAG: DUF3696 domain-containing protein [Anaerolineae bacterium]|nr:DUF3696 domain-containing protein [Anaerolineae bacterium]
MSGLQRLRPERRLLHHWGRRIQTEGDGFGNITNWPQDFFGDEFGELAAMAEAEMRRQQAEEATQTA